MKKSLLILLFALGVSYWGWGQTQLAAWTFDATPAAPNTPTIVSANLGIQAGEANIYSDGTNGSSSWITSTTGNELTAFAGTTVNDPRGGSALAGMSYVAVGGTGNSANGKSWVLKFSTFGYENPVLTFATRYSGTTAFNTHQWAWSIDGSSFTSFGSNTAPTSTTFTLRTLDMSSINDIDDVTNVYLRITFSGSTNATSNNRLDNIVINATPISSGGPSKLAITNLNDGKSPFENIPFNITVQAQDENNVPQQVSSDVNISLSGTGIGGTTTGTILSGENSVVISGVTMSEGYGLTITATQTSGTPTLTDGNSSPFYVMSATPNYSTQTSGNWNAAGTWEIQISGNWYDALEYPDASNKNATILNSHTVTVTDNNGKFNNLTVDNGGKVWVGTTTNRFLYSYGDITCNGTIGDAGGTDGLGFDIEGGSCTISGNGLFKINRMAKFTTASSTTNLTIDMDVSLMYNHATNSALYNNVSGTTTFNITLNAGKHLTAPNAKIDLTGCTLTLKSNASGTASLIDNGTISGQTGTNVTVERYLTQNKWHYVSAPVDDPTANVFFGMYMMRWNEPSGVWSYIVDPAYVLSNDLEGFAIWSNNNATSVFTGQLNTGSKSIAATADGPFVHNGYNFFGNPYPSSLDWNVNDGSGWSRTAGNIEPTLYIWNHTYLNYGVYVKDGATGTLDVDNIIPPHQGFFVHCSAASGSLGVNNGARIHASKDILKSGASVSDLLKLKVEGNTYADEIILQIDPMGSVNAGMFDALKFHGDVAAPQLYSLSKDGKELSINSFPESEDYNVIPLGMEAGVDAIYTLSISDLNGFASGNLYLEDVKEGTFTKLDDNMVYTFTAGPNDDPVRFLLHLNGQLAVPENIQGLSDVKVYSFDQDVYIVSENGLSGSTVIYDLLGREILREKLNGETMKKFDLTGHNGYMIVRVTTEKGSLNQKVYLR
jgi:hypothetical protein